MSDAPLPPAVLIERQGHIMIITINRPEARNAVNRDVSLGVGEAIEEADRDDEIRVVIITGAGDKSFCAGADLKAISRGESLVPQEPEKAAWGFGGIVAHPISKPMIAAVNGTALGGGCEIVLACDIAVAAETATFSLPEVKYGLIAGAGGSFRLVKQIPVKRAMEYLLTGDSFSADTAKELGLLNHVVPAANLMSEALVIAEKIAANAPLAVQASKRVAMQIVDGKQVNEAEIWKFSLATSSKNMKSEDAREGPLAFAEKRAPVWKAR